MDRDLVLSLEDTLAHTDVDLEEFLLLMFFQIVFLGEIRLGLVVANGLHKLGYLHLATMLLEVHGKLLLGRLAECHEEVELGEGDEAVLVHISDVHDFLDLIFELPEVLLVVLWLLEVVWSQSAEEVFVGHLCLTLMIDARGECFVDLLWCSKESHFVLSLSPVVFLFSWRLGCKCQFRFVQINVGRKGGR